MKKRIIQHLAVIFFFWSASCFNLFLHRVGVEFLVVFVLCVHVRVVYVSAVVHVPWHTEIRGQLLEVGSSQGSNSGLTIAFAH